MSSNDDENINLEEELGYDEDRDDDEDDDRDDEEDEF